METDFGTSIIAAAHERYSRAFHNLAAINQRWRTPIDLGSARYCMRDAPCPKHRADRLGQESCARKRETAEELEGIGMRFIARMAEFLGYETNK